MLDLDHITTISFDADGTLWDFDQVMRRALRYALDELCGVVPLPPGSLSIETMIAIRDRVAEELKGRVMNLEQVRLEAFRRTLEYIGVLDENLAVHLNAVYLKHRFEDIQLFDDVLPTLDALQRHYMLGLLSNGNSYPERCGLEGRFQFVVFSQDYGIEKPDPRLFNIAMKQAGCVARELMHVGDSLETDVAGAKRAGVWSVWLNREGKSNDSDIQADFEISSLAELLGICGKLA